MTISVAQNRIIKTQYTSANVQVITQEMVAVAANEKISPEVLLQRIGSGEVVIPANPKHTGLIPIGIGRGLRTKVNVNLGTSSSDVCVEDELGKIKLSAKYGADTVMDLSTGGNLNQIRQELISATSMPFGTVPIYQSVQECQDILKLTPEKLLETLEEHGRQGVDFVTLHCGIKLEMADLIRQRLMGIVSRGGAMIWYWMNKHHQENPFYQYYNEILEICGHYDMTISLGDGLRPGCLHDATDAAQLAELDVLGGLVLRARTAGVQVMVEGPGHVPMHQIEYNIKKQKEVCHGAPFYVLGPLVTDVAPGYDHITAAIGAAMAGWYGADFLCYVTPKEHLGLPNMEDVRDGLIAFKIAAHAADIAKGVPAARDWDDRMSAERHKLNWGGQFELAIDPERARQLYGEVLPEQKGTCSMCDKFCAYKMYRETTSQ